MDTIFLDTNSIRNEKANHFFGNYSRIKEISRLVDIAVPSIVIDEIIRQKKRFLSSQLEKIKTNYFAEFIEFENKYLGNCQLHIDEKIQDLYDNSQNEFPYKVVDLEHTGKLEKIKELAIKNIPPFEAESDKGFKDSYIHLTICEFADLAEDDVFLLTSDKRLKESFNDKEVEVLSDLQEYFSFRQEYFKNQYFIGRLNEYFETKEIKPKHILSSELTEDDDWKIILEFHGEEINILVDFYSKEIIDVIE
jgi:rRNA-processing protein FCF1